jgi:hypothetical protein
LESVLEDVPNDWLIREPGAETPEAKRTGYLQYLLMRLEAAPLFVEEALNARANLV